MNIQQPWYMSALSQQLIADMHVLSEMAHRIGFTIGDTDDLLVGKIGVLERENAWPRLGKPVSYNADGLAGDLLDRLRIDRDHWIELAVAAQVKAEGAIGNRADDIELDVNEATPTVSEAIGMWAVAQMRRAA